MNNGSGLMFLRMQIGRAWWLPVIFFLATLTAIKAGDFTYTINADNATITITGYTGPAGAVVIPPTIDGKTVTGIGDYAFDSSDSPTSVTIGNNITNIGNYAFNQCAILRSAVMGSSVTHIGDAAFYDCPYLTSVTIGNGVISIGSRAFNSCNRLVNVTIGNSVTRIGSWAFWNCNRLTSVMIPDSVTGIGDHAFADCTDLYNVTIGTGITNIEDQAFGSCSSLTDLYFHGNAPSLGSDVFDEYAAATIYYLPGTTGWEQTFGGLPTVLWDAPPPSAPTGVSASDGTFSYKVQVTWNAASGATFYQVFRHTINDSAGADQIGTSFSTTYDDTSADYGPTYYYWVKAVNAAGASGFSTPDSGILNAEGTLITANGLVGTVYLNSGNAVTISVAMMNMDPYFGSEVDWWVIAFAHSSEWYYLNNALQWAPFAGDLESCQPVYSGPIFNLPVTTVLDRHQLPRGSYDFWFAVDYPADGILDPNGQILFDKVTVVVQ